MVAIAFSMFSTLPSTAAADHEVSPFRLTLPELGLAKAQIYVGLIFRIGEEPAKYYTVVIRWPAMCNVS